jgi:hypothetical protein
MKQLTFLALVLILAACKDQVNELQLHDNQSSDLKEHNMKIIPENPNSQVEIKLVVFDDCTYHQLSVVTRKDNNIDIQKQFNGMMKWPCMMKNDTILIGKLLEGTYHVNYTLIDISQQAPQNISLSFTFQLKVAK